MSVMVWMKSFADLCCYFSLLYAFPNLFPTEIPGVLAAAFLSVGVFWRAVCDEAAAWYRLRYLGMICPVLCAGMLVRSAGTAAVFLPPCLYAAVLIVRGRLKLQYYEYRLFFRHVMGPWVFLFLLLFTVGAADRMMLDHLNISYGNMLYYGCFFAVTGVVLLRGLRLGLENDMKRSWGQLAELALAFGGIALAAYLIQVSASWLLRLLRGVGLALMTPWILLIKSMSASHSDRLEEIMETAAAQTEAAGDGTAAMTGLAQGDTIITRLLGMVSEQLSFLDRIPWGKLAVLLAVLAACAALGYFCYTFFFGHQDRTGSSFGEGQAQPQQKRPGAGRRRESRRSSREKIRAVYRDYLKIARQNEVRLTVSTTSGEILSQMQAKKDSEAAVRLREIYLAARYQEREEITEEQVRAARTALREVKRAR